MESGQREPGKFRRPARKMGGGQFQEAFEKGFRSDPSTGHWCRACNERHPWRKMKLRHEPTGKAFRQMWLCPKTGDVIHDEIIERKEQNDV
jgi:hypothetical protein